MADFIYTRALYHIMQGNISFGPGTSDDFRLLLVQADTTADTEEDTIFVSGFSDLSEPTADGSYARQTLANETLNEDTTGDEAEFNADDATFTFAGDGEAQNIQAAVLIKHVTTDADSIPIAYIDSGGFPFAQQGTVTVTWAVEGIIKALNPP